jgi:hypothetical protein
MLWTRRTTDGVTNMLICDTNPSWTQTSSGTKGKSEGSIRQWFTIQSAPSPVCSHILAISQPAVCLSQKGSSEKLLMHFITCSRMDVWPFTVCETRMPWHAMADSWLSQDMHGDRNVISPNFLHFVGLDMLSGNCQERVTSTEVHLIWCLL